MTDLRLVSLAIAELRGLMFQSPVEQAIELVDRIHELEKQGEVEG